MKQYIWFLLLVSPALAQVEQATITGTVTDSSGAVVPGARVSVTNVKTGVSGETQTNAEGQYRVPYLHPGEYEVVVAKDGFDKARVAGVTLTVGLTATIAVVLKPGALQQEVLVTSSVVQLEQQSASLGNVVGSRQILELPLLGRNPYSLVMLAPGVLPKGSAGVGPIVNGGRSNTSEVLLDGAESRNSTTNDIAYTPPLETVQEFKILTNNFSAEYGRSGGGVLTAATRSGTNELHGALYEFLRNDKLNANGWSNNRSGLPRSTFRRNEYGISAGGPIYLPRLYNGRNQSFFFVNWEETPQRSPDNIRTTVPTALERAGDFSQTVTNRGQLIQIFDPATTRPDPSRAGQFIRDPSLDNRIPAGRFDPIALKTMAFLPAANRNEIVNNYVLSNTRRNDTGKLFLRFDHNVGAKQRLFVTFGKQNNEQFTPGVNAGFPGEGTNGEQGRIESHSKLAVVSDTVTFRPELIGEFRGSITRRPILATPRSVGYDFTQLGFPQSLKNQAAALLFPRFTISDSTALGPDRASYFNDTEQAEEFQGHVTWLRGRHSLKAGADYTLQTFNVYRPERPGGFYDFSRVFTQGPNPVTSSSTAGYGVATFLLGAPTGGSFSFDPSLATSQRFYGWYWQDDWKVLRNLTLNLGIRYEYQTPWNDRFDQLGFFDPDFADPLTKQKGLLRFTGRDGASRYQSDPDKNNFAPRVGLAWQFRKNTVFRAGYGLFYFPGSGGIGAGASDLGSGFLTQTSVFLGPPPAAPNTPPPGASLADPFKAGFFLPPSSGVGSSINTAFRDWVTPYNQHWNANFQHTLGRDLLIEVAYVGSRGQRIWVNRNRSAASTQFLALGSQLDDVVPNPYFGVIPTGSLSAATVRRSQLLKPFNHYTDVSRFRDAIGDSVYHGFTLRADKSMGHGLSIQGAYTVSKQIDNVQERFSGRTSFIDPNNLALSRSVGDYDRPQYLVLNYIYDFPIGQGQRWLGRGLVGRVVGNWQLSGITSFGKGLPIVITGPNNTRLPGVSAAAARLKSPVLADGQQTLDRWFDTTAFAPAPTYSLGNDSRTEPNLRTPGVKTWDLAMSRNQRIRENIRLQFRAEFFNAFNTPQFDSPNGSVTATTFGQITSAGGARVIQMGLRLSY
ncbi:MAG: carboxypeptidase regulatory-like domain-containing protein [Acidobacteria bacterium]|nr:carboxypeptidase regulatory-like domain-containing protein [Acidobacteriota bacterium]